MKMGEKMKKAVKILSAAYIISLLFDFAISVSSYLKNAEYFMAFESNAFLKNSLKGSAADSLIIIAIASLPLMASFLFVKSHDKSALARIVFAIISASLFLLTVGHLLGGISWLV